MVLTERPLLLLLAVLSLVTIAPAQLGSNQGVRLADSTLGNHAGRVEVMYYGRWGTVCDSGWGSSDASVICRMLNFTGAACAVRGAPEPFGPGTGTVWLSYLRCYSYHTHLDQCWGSNPQNINPCSHSRDAAVICQDPSVMPVPYDVTMISHTTRSIELRWHLDFIPEYIGAISFNFNYTEDGSSYSRTQRYRQVVNATDEEQEFNYTLTGLRRNTSYTISIRAEGEYQWCLYWYPRMIGEYSDSITVSTNATVPPSTLPMRLVSSDTRSYIGRFQVQYEGVWGNICDDGFDMEDADVACYGLNYTRGAICYANRPFPQTTDPILLDDVNCRAADRFEDCTHSGWRVHNCGSYEAIGLVCNPGDIGPSGVTGLRAKHVGPTTITVEWNAVSNIQQYRLYLNASGERPRTYFTSLSATEYTFSWLVIGVNYSISIATVNNFREFYGGNCRYQNFYGDVSDPIYVVPRESPPTIPIRDFHVSILNTTSVEVTWNPPSSSTAGVNGVIRGYKLIVRRENETEERIINISATVGLSRVYILNDLVENVTYYFSILMYTVGDGPRSVKLRVTIPNLSNLPLIIVFGKWGNKFDIQRENTYNRGFNVLCGSNIPDVTYEWRFANGSSIGILNQGFRAAHFTNGTAVLQIGTALLYTRRLTLCDGGVYTCVATNAADRTEERNFTLIIGFSQPRLNTPTLIRSGSTWIQIEWDPLNCDGGYTLDSYIVQYRTGSYCYYCSYTTADEVTSLNYTIRNLSPNTRYSFRIGRRSSISSSVGYSNAASFFTLTSGPSQPERVAITAGFNSEVCATWRRPSLPVGTIILYNLYAEPVENSQDIYDSIDLPYATSVKTFPGSWTSGCMRLNKTDIVYHFQMSAVALIQGLRVEGTLSRHTAQSTVYVPKPGILKPERLTVNTANTTASVGWSLPPNTHLEDNADYFNVSYSGMVEWTSPSGAYSKFLEQGWIKTRDYSATFSYLTPSTNYVFSVAIVTVIETGPSATISNRTTMETGDKLAFFQIRIENIGECSEWVDMDKEGTLSDIESSLTNNLLSLCLIQPKISQGEFSCRTEPSDSVVYRARISGTPSQSANDVRDCISNWVMTGEGSVNVDGSRHHLDPSCDTILESIHAPDCGAITTTPTTEVPPGTADSRVSGANPGQVTGIFLGALIAGLLIAVIIILACILYRKFKSKELMKLAESRMNVMMSESRSSLKAGNDET